MKVFKSHRRIFLSQCNYPFLYFSCYVVFFLSSFVVLYQSCSTVNVLYKMVKSTHLQCQLFTIVALEIKF